MGPISTEILEDGPYYFFQRNPPSPIRRPQMGAMFLLLPYKQQISGAPLYCSDYSSGFQPTPLLCIKGQPRQNSTTTGYFERNSKINYTISMGDLTNSRVTSIQCKCNQQYHFIVNLTKLNKNNGRLGDLAALGSSLSTISLRVEIIPNHIQTLELKLGILNGECVV